jgi:peptide alpha-N-acetyltransferase
MSNSKGKGGGGGGASSATSPVDNKRQLPSKEASLFRQIVKFYETKQYKKGLKAADQILKKFPEHGETLSMKGLTLNCLDKKQEAYEFVRNGLKNDLRSHVCWHVYGLLYRSDQEYREAIKCYMNALRLDKENIQILRDLSMLQIQMRDLSGFVETRRQLLTLRPAQRTNWIAFAVSHHLVCNYEMCLHVLEAYEKTVAEESEKGAEAEGKKTNANEEAFEASEMLLYKARVLEEGGQFEQAIGLLTDKANAKKILDKLGAKEALGRMYRKSDQLQKAKDLYSELIDMNPENIKYHDGLFQSIGLPTLSKCNSSHMAHANKKSKFGDTNAPNLSKEDRMKMIAEFERLQKVHPKCIAFGRRIIDLHSCEDDPDGSSFSIALDKYVRPWLKKGIPSLFQSLKDLYNKKQNVELIQRLFESYEKTLRAESRLPPVVNQQQQEEENVEKSQEILVWVLAFLSQHYDHTGQIQQAIDKVDRAITLDPKVVELHTIKSKIMKHAGDLTSASQLSDHARELDLADRYLNCHTVKYMLRAGQIEKANSLAVLFTKDNTPAKEAAAKDADPLNSLKNLHEMQCIWYEYELGKAYKKLCTNNATEKPSSKGFENMGRALHQFKYILKHFDDMHEDQFDFHSYCLRKMTLRSYLDMLKFENKLYSHPFYCKAACEAIKCYLHLHDDPPALRREQERKEEELKVAQMAPNERKKYKAKQRKLQKKKEEEEKQQGTEGAASGGGAGKDTRPFAVKEESQAQKDLYTEKPLDEAKLLLDKLLAVEDKGNNHEAQLLAFEWGMRTQKYLYALSALRNSQRIAGLEDPDVHRCLVRLVKEKKDSIQNAVVEKVLKEMLGQMLSNLTLDKYCQQWVERNGERNVQSCIAGAETIAMAEATGGSVDLEALLMDKLIKGGDKWFDASRDKGEACDHVASVEALAFLVEEKKLEKVGASWKSLAAKHFRHSELFSTSASLSNLSL